MSSAPDDAPGAAKAARPAYLTEATLLARLEQAQKHLCLPPPIWSVLVEVICPDQEDYRTAPLPAKATKTLPGTEARIRVLIERAGAGEQLFHPCDRVFRTDETTDRLGVLIKKRRNGSESRVGEPVVRQGWAGMVPVSEEFQPDQQLMPVADLGVWVQKVIACQADLAPLTAALQHQKKAALVEVALLLGLDLSQLRGKGGTFLRGLLSWIGRERKRTLRKSHAASPGKPHRSAGLGKEAANRRRRKVV